MNRRRFLLAAGAAGATTLAGCAGGDPDHLAEFRANLEERGLDLNGVEMHSDDVVVTEFQTTDVINDIAAAGLAYVDQVDAGWRVSRVDGLAREDVDLGWHAELGWAEAFIDGELSAQEYGTRLSETVQQVIVIEEGGDIEDIQTSESDAR